MQTPLSGIQDLEARPAEPSDRKGLHLGSPWEHMRIENQDEPWGSVLDAGTGEQSLGWLVEQESSSWTAVTACSKRMNGLRRTFAQKMRREDRLVLGTWSDPHLLSGEVYDTVIAQYLLGAIERFDPYQEHRLFRRLRPLVGRQLFVVGLQPMNSPSNSEELLILRLLNYRDVAFVHDDARHYREYPLRWVQQNLLDSGFEIRQTRCFQNLIGKKFANGLIDSGQSRAESFWDQQFAQDFKRHGERLGEEAHQALKAGPLHGGYDYLISASPKDVTPRQPRRTNVRFNKT